MNSVRPVIHSKVVFVKLGCAGSIDMVSESRKRFNQDLKWDRVAWSGIIAGRVRT